MYAHHTYKGFQNNPPSPDREIPAGVKRIRIHDLRHSHVAHCIELGFSPLEIAERMGHEGINITFNYAHLYPSKQKALADKLNEDRGKMDVDEMEE